MSEAVLEAVDNLALRFVGADRAEVERIAELVPVFRVKGERGHRPDQLYSAGIDPYVGVPAGS